MQEAPNDPFTSRFGQGMYWTSDAKETKAFTNAYEVFGALKDCNAALVDNPLLLLRLGLLEALGDDNLTHPDGLNEAMKDIRFGLTEGRCVDPGRLLFGKAMPLLLIARRLGLEPLAQRMESTAFSERLTAELELLRHIGERGSGVERL